MSQENSRPMELLKLANLIDFQPDVLLLPAVEGLL